MSQENVEAFKRFVDGFNRRDVEAMLEEVDAGVEWRPAAPVALGGEATVYRGHAGIPDGIRDLHDSFAELQIEISEIQQVGERVVGIGRIRTRGKGSGSRVLVAVRCRDGVHERQSDSDSLLPRSPRGPRSSRAAGVAHT